MAGREHGLVVVAPGARALVALSLLLSIVVVAACGDDDDAHVELIQRPDSRLVKVQTVGLAAFGPINPHMATAADTVATFGEPADVAEGGSTCARAWPDLGLTIEFASEDDPCADDALLVEARTGGPAAERERWRTAEGIRPGMSVAAARRFYPEARRNPDGELVLVELLRERRSKGSEPVLAVTTEGGRVEEMVFPVRPAPG